LTKNIGQLAISIPGQVKRLDRIDQLYLEKKSISDNLGVLGVFGLSGVEPPEQSNRVYYVNAKRGTIKYLKSKLVQADIDEDYGVIIVQPEGKENFEVYYFSVDKGLELLAEIDNLKNPAFSLELTEQGGVEVTIASLSSQEEFSVSPVSGVRQTIKQKAFILKYSPAINQTMPNLKPIGVDHLPVSMLNSVLVGRAI